MTTFDDNCAKINWASLKTAHGSAEHVPDALKGLMSRDAAIRDKSYWLLDNHVVLQSDLYESAYAVIPFLLDILRGSDTHARREVYNLLFEIANGYAPPDVTITTETGQSAALTDACSDLLRQSIDVISKGVTDPDPEVKKTAEALLQTLTAVDDGG